MPRVRLASGWLLSPAFAKAFVPILRREIDRLKSQGVRVDPLILAELAEGEKVALDNFGQNPDDTPDAHGEEPTLALVKGLRHAAKISGVPRSTLAELVHSGALAAERRGTVLYFDAEHLRGLRG